MPNPTTAHLYVTRPLLLYTMLHCAAYTRVLQLLEAQPHCTMNTQHKVVTATGAKRRGNPFHARLPKQQLLYAQFL
jgi:hypothetical protein